MLPLSGKIVTADAMFCQREVCQKILDEDADYVVTVKDNQPTLRSDIQQAFEKVEGFSPLPTG
ncbi:MAG: ISAs1 family transposase, partial [Gemmataceae bacterium]